MSATTETQIETAITEVILGLAITPQTTVVSAIAGSNYADVADASAFVMQGTASWWDGTGEPEMGIAGVDANRITFETALAHDHASGAVLSTNLLDYRPESFGAYLVKGDPFIFVTAIESAVGYQAQRLTGGPITIQVQVNLLDEQRDQIMHPNLWTKQQQRTAKDLLRQIITAIARNNHLTVSTGTYAQGIGENGQHIARMAFDRWVTRENVPVFAAATHIVVRPRPLNT